MECLEENVGVSNKVSSFVLPLGATVNMNGTALYECAAALFLAQAYGLDLTFGVQFTIVAIALMTSIGVPGDVVYEDEYLVAVNKAAGILTIPDRFRKDIPNLFDLLSKERPELVQEAAFLTLEIILKQQTMKKTK